MTDKCPKCKLWYLIYDNRDNQARCLNPDCTFKQSCSKEYYLKNCADKNRMVILPKELGGGLNKSWQKFITRYSAD